MPGLRLCGGLPPALASHGQRLPLPEVTKAPQLPLQAEEAQLSLCTRPFAAAQPCQGFWGVQEGAGAPTPQQSWQKSLPSE